ncbi:MAG: molybdopterin-dependent oxidoreductase, partial [Clostridia bacterium]|nr:molybdopterin-dependent oxidoreductase [Clostridia bacterium]
HGKQGKLVKVEGDPAHGYSRGRLCAKGYAYPQYVYSPERLRYPLLQYPRGSGSWERISWEKALDLIACKLLELHDRYGTNLAAAFNKFSGNLGLLHYAVEGFFNSLGAHTRPVGNLCQAAGWDGQSCDFGEAVSPDPELMAQAAGIVIWGANPAATSLHQWHFINQARKKGAKLIVIDPVFTPTAAQADSYIQINPGTDGMLALAVAKLLIKERKYDRKFVAKKVKGWGAFRTYLEEKFSLEEAGSITGVPMGVMLELARLYTQSKPCASWIGFGLQRHGNGGQNVRAIDALAALSGNLGRPGGGVYYQHLKTCFPSSLENYAKDISKPRQVNLLDFPRQALALQDPPVRFLWVACRNPLSQDPEPQLWSKLLGQMELTVTVDLFMTETARLSDLVLPAASFFEDYDLHHSYWHHWVALNEKAIGPYFEAKSDLEIMSRLAERLNRLSPEFTTFPVKLSSLDWVAAELNEKVRRLLGVEKWQDFLSGPRKLKISGTPWQDAGFKTPSGKYELYSEGAKKMGLPALPVFKEPKRRPSPYPFRLLTPQSLLRLHSQFGNLPWLNSGREEEGLFIEVNEAVARSKGLKAGDEVKVFNAFGAVTARLKLNSFLPRQLVIMPQLGAHSSANRLISYIPTDMGGRNTQAPGIAYYDAQVNFVKCRREREDG